MARRAPAVVLLLILLVAAVTVSVVHASVVGGEDGGAAGTRRRWLQDVVNSTTTNGTASYISYGALLPDTVPCSVQGASYYNCRPGADANPYQRGCSAITRCRD